MPGAQSQGRAASMQPLGTSKNKKGHHPNTPPLWETSRAQHCEAKCMGMYIMETLIKMPQLSPTMTSGTIVRWHKKIGDKVCPGDLLLELETAEFNMEFEIPEQGYLVEIMVSEGISVDIDTVICVLSDTPTRRGV
jgi:biotin carboxyl carrier protein